MKWTIIKYSPGSEDIEYGNIEAEAMTITDNGDLVILTRDKTNRITPKLVIAAGFWLEARLVEEEDSGSKV